MSSWATWIKVALDAAKGIAKVSEIGYFCEALRGRQDGAFF